MAYRSSSQERDRTKAAVLDKIAPRCAVFGTGAIRLVGDVIVHVRYCARSHTSPWFNINPTTLRAHYELWILGSENWWYLLPVSVISEMDRHPCAYPDRHRGYTVVSVDPAGHRAAYARPKIARDISPYFRSVLPPSRNGDLEPIR